MTGKRIRVADIVCGIMNRTDMREADHADDEQPQGHRQYGLSNSVCIGSAVGVGGLGLLHVWPRRRCSFLTQNGCGRDLNLLTGGRHPGSLGGNSPSLQLVFAAILRGRLPETPLDER